MITQKFNDIFTLDALLKGHYKGRISKRQKRPIIRFEISMLENIYSIYNKLQSGRYKVGRYNSFVIYEPKQREIQTLHYSDRIVQHVLCDDVLMPYFSKRAILDNCVCQIGKGTHFALKRFETSMRKFIKKYGNNGYILKCDTAKYFPSMPHSLLKQTFGSHIQDEQLKQMIYNIIDSFHTNPQYLAKHNIKPLYKRIPTCEDEKFLTERGIPIGNQTSQVFGMFYLDKIDRLIKEKLRIKIYSRYMDDFVIVHNDKEFLKYVLKVIKQQVVNMGLNLNEKTQIFPIKNGLTYLGFRYQVTDTGKLLKKVSKKTVKRFCSRAKLLNRAYADDVIDITRVAQSLAAYNGHLKHGNCYKLHQNLLKRIKVAEIAKQKIEKLKELELLEKENYGTT